MPTNRLNISLVDKIVIDELKEIRKCMERDYDGRFSFSDVVKALIINRPNIDKLIDSITLK